MLLNHEDLVAGVMGSIIAASERSVVTRPGDYRDDDGFLHCGICGEKKETILSWQQLRVPCTCRCDREKQTQREEEDRRERVERRKRRCFSHEELWRHTFNNDNRRQPKMELGRKYVKEWADMRRNNIGLILMGNVGTGKSYCAAAIANALCELDIPVKFINLVEVLNDLQSNPDRNEYIRTLTNFSLLIIDDFGIQRQSEYAMEQVFNVIDNRIRSGKPMIVTTNLSLEDLKMPDDVPRKRIYDRILSVCQPILFEGESMRQEERAARRKVLREAFEG